MVERERVLGRFTIGERIGSGGHGTVHRAWDERLCRHVAVKSVEGPAAGRILREAHAAARLSHPGIVTLYELGEENGQAFLVSELVAGGNLRELAAEARLSDREVAEIGAEVAAALAHAHAHGVIHRDLKPDNILVRGGRGRRGGDGERAKLADFGIASVLDEPSLTATGQVVGTLAYMAPEQAAGEIAGAEADVYSLALTLYELWAGANPVAQASPAATARAIGEPLTPLAELRPELPAELCAAVDACLEPEPEARPALGELREALLGLRGSLHPDRAVPEPALAPEDVDVVETMPARPFAVLLAAAAFALVATLAGMPGLAVALVALFVPAALLLERPRDWLLPGLAPVLGLAGCAPAFLAVAASHRGTRPRVALAGLAWAWTGIAGAALGAELGVVAPGDGAGWLRSASGALDVLIAPLSSPDALAVALVWMGATVVLGLLLDLASPATVAVTGLVWAASLVAALAAIGGPAAPSPLLALALMAAIGYAVWERAGRAPLRPAIDRLTSALAPGRASQAPPGGGRHPRSRRHPEGAPLERADVRAGRVATRHVQAALHGAGSRAGLP